MLIVQQSTGIHKLYSNLIMLNTLLDNKKELTKTLLSVCTQRVPGVTFSTSHSSYGSVTLPAVTDGRITF